MTLEDIFGADKIMIGSVEAFAMYIGDTLLWSAESDQPSSRLPTGYTEIAGIASTPTGGQYIDLGIKLCADTNTTKIWTKFNLKGVGSDNSNQATFMSSMEEDSPYIGFVFRKTSYDRIQFTSNEMSSYSEASNFVEQNILPIGTLLETSENGVSLGFMNSGKTHQITTTLFCGKNSSGNPQRFCEAYLYYLKIQHGDTLIKDLVPCLNSSNIAGLYDLIDGIFYASEGTEDFVPLYSIDNLQEIEYLESTGTQYINTDYKVWNYGLSGELRMQRTGNSTDERAYIGRVDQGGFNLYTKSSPGIELWLQTDSSITLSSGGTYFDKNTHFVQFEMRTDGSVLTVDGDSHTVSHSYTNGTKSYIQLFSHRGYYNSEGRIYYCKLYDNGTLIYYFIPVRVGNVGYMYDIVSGKLFGNSGTGSFILGPDLQQGSYDYEVEYLQSDSNQYIDLNIIPDENTGMFLRAQHNTTTDQYVAGTRNDSNSTRWCFGHSQNGWYWGYGIHSTLGSGTYMNTVAELSLNYLNSGKAIVEVDGTQYNLSLDSLGFTPTGKIRLFGSSGASESYNKWNGKIYEVKISQGSTIVADLIPVVKRGAGYMYDKIGGTLYGNEGTGLFTYGQKSGELPINYQEVKYVKSTSGGNQCIDLGIKLYETLNTQYDIAIKFNTENGNANQAVIFNCQDTENDPWPGTFIRVSSNKVQGRYIGSNTKDYNLGNVGDIIELTAKTSPNKNVYNLNNSGRTHSVTTSLFGALDSTYSVIRPIVAKLYYFKLFVGGQLVRDLIPCIRTVDSKPGLYDLVGRKFYVPGLADFVAGPPQYVEVEYLQSSGTQVVDSGIYNSATTVVEMKMSAQGTDRLNGAEPNTGARYKWGSNGNGQVYYGFKDNATASSVTCQLDTPYLYHLEQSNQYVKDMENNTILSTTYVLSAYSSDTIRLFRFRSGSQYGNTGSGSMRIYYCNITDGTNTIRLIPVRVGSTGYMYDTVNEQLYANAGTGEFVIGPDKQ